MARLLLIWKPHANEIFAGRVGRLIKRLGLLEGHETLLEPGSDKSLIGQVMRSPKGQRIDFQEVEHIVKHGILAGGRRLIEKHNPDIAYAFHCSPPAGGLERPDSQAFWITTYYSSKGVPIRCIEINTLFKLLPPKIQRIIKSRTTQAAWDSGRVYKYAMQTTADREMRLLGLTPEKFAIAISALIKKDIRLHEAGHELPFAQGTVGEVKSIVVRPLQNRASRKVPRIKCRRRRL
ncbi:MAG: hypothetical protein NTW59_02305 [Candidatus Diapherotrites archaeon]|nr:hypothetical protein [Candidatus Diapherotrites archaeon]